jgi:DNA-binding IclR family transcriptional regulator
MASAQPPHGTGPRRSVSPPTGRVIAVIALLVSQPEHEFKLSDIVSELAISKATCYAVIRALLDAGYVVRSPRTKGYLLGPSLIAAGRAAELAFPAVRMAGPTVRHVANQHNVECVASIIENGFITVIDWASPNSSANHARSWSHVGQRVPVVPPFGAVQVAWMDDEHVQEWLDRASPLNRVTDLQAALDAVRSRGYDVQSENDSLARFREALAIFDGKQLSEEMQDAIDLLMAKIGQVEYLPARLRADRGYSVNAISAPVFDSAGHPVLTLSMHVERRMTGREIESTGRDLRRAADEITEAVGGHAPGQAPRARAG